jgi:hypothetical protein
LTIDILLPLHTHDLLRAPLQNLPAHHLLKRNGIQRYLQ